MQYELIPPPGPLKSYIRYCWRFENKTGNAHPNTLKVVADGCPGILYIQSGDVQQYGQKLTKLSLYGQSVEPTQLDLTGNFAGVGICFYPDALKVLFGLSAFELTDTCMDMDALSPVREHRLLQRLLQAPSATLFEPLFRYLSTHLQRNEPATDPMVAHALNAIIREDGNLSLRRLQESLRVSERSLERRFKESVGVSPKLFTRICRFQAALNQLKNGHYDKLSTIAFDNGYADHSHFTRTFKEFTGILPEQYQRKTNPLTENFPQLLVD